MSKEEKQLVPKLRFPEFYNDVSWKEKFLNDLSPSIFDGTHQTPKYTQNGIPFFSVENIVSGSDNKFISREDYLYETRNNKPEYGDILVTRIGSIGIPKVVDWKYEFSVYVTLAVIKKSAKFDSNFLAFYIESNRFQQEIKRRSLLNAAPQKINMNELRSCEVLLPPKKEEQQKIANCLSSLDEVINAETEKLRLLQDHKKGLLQQLFPQEGETQPKYRFPEFKGDGDWEMPLFSKYIKLYRGSSPRPINLFLTDDENGVNWIKIGDTKNAINYKLYEVEQKISVEGSKKSRKVRKGDGCIYDGWFVLREYEDGFDKQFLIQLLNSDNLQRQYKRLAAGGIVQNISSEIVYNTIIPKSSKEEQQKIAICLSSVDNLIEAQSQKIEDLQKHKEGLLQQLFPSVNEL